MTPQILCDLACDTGENPYWHPLEKRLYWTDIPQGKLYWVDPQTGEHAQCFQGPMVGGFTMQADGSLLLFMDKGMIALFRNGKIQRVLRDTLPLESKSRFNDVIADPEGRVFCGTMPSKDGPGRLYRLDRDGSIEIVLEDVHCSNGMGFTPDLKQMYFTDSYKREIYRFDYDRATGKLSNQRVVIRTDAKEGVPDGMTMDTRGHLWSTRWGDGCVVEYSPEGTELRRIGFPAKWMTSVVFGGDNYREMYFTSAGGPKKEQAGPGAGAIFRLCLEGVQGQAEFCSRIS